MAKILIYDLEVTPLLGWTYGAYKTNVIKVEKQPAIMSISWRWYGDAETHHASLANIPRKRGTSSNTALVKLIRDLFDEADIVVAHNANRFDNKVATAAFIRHNLLPPSPYRTIDTLQVLRGISRFTSNALNAIGAELELGTKTDVKHGDIWYACINGDAKAWKLLEEYNNQDVEILYQLYERLRPYIKNHVNLGDLNGERGHCPKCGSPELEKRGYSTSASGKKARYQCKNCGGWCNEATVKGNGRIVNA